MKQSFLKLPKQPTRFAPEFISRRMGMRSGHFHNAAYRTDGEGTPEETAALLEKVRTATREEIEKRNYASSDQVTNIVNKMMENMPLDALRNYGTDKNKLEESIRNIAGEVEKINKRATNVSEVRANLVMEALDSKAEGEDQTGWEKIERAMKSRGRNTNVNEVITLNVRAAANMTVSGAIDETTYSIPNTLIESMSIAEFAGKRYGTQFINAIADRTVLPEITQTKTWLEEGTPQGAFAIVAEGAVKPLVSTSLVRNYSVAKKVAGKYVITEEFAKFRQEAFTIIKRLINDKMVRDYTNLLVTDLNNLAAGYVGTTLDATIIAPTDYDAIGAVAAQEETLNFNPDVLILHPQDKWRLSLEKDSQGRYYMLIPMNGPDGTTRMMGFNVVTSTYQTVGYFTLGESGLFKIEEEPVTIRIGYGIDVTTTSITGTTVVSSVISDFDSNKMRMIIETWFNDWIPTPYVGAYVKASFSTVKAALLKP
jgi:hypothetical protein